jgi:hypothetical protein
MLQGCDDAPFYPNVSKHVQLHVYPNFKSAQETKKLKHMLVIKKGFSHLPLKCRQRLMWSKTRNLQKILNSSCECVGLKHYMT